MTDKCVTNERDCPITSDFLQSYGEMRAQVAEMHKIIANGNGLVQRVNRLEVAKGKFMGGLILLSVLAPIATAIAMKLLGE